MSKDSIFAWDPTAANNSDIAGTDISGATGKVKDGDNALRTIMAQIAANDVQRGSDIATASTVDFTAATTPALTHDLTGTVTVTAVTMTATHWRVCRAQGVFQLTASSTLVVNGSTSTNYTTTAGDLLVFFGYSASTVRVWTVTGGSQTPASATTSAQGIVELATVAEALAGTDAVRAVTPAGLYFPTGHLWGCTLSNNGVTPASKIDIAVGTCRDGSDTQNIICAAMTAKDLASNWAAGSSAGIRYSGAAIADGTYHIYAVAKALGASQDYYAHPSGSTDATVLTHLQAETGGSAYLYVRRIGSIVRSSGSILAFHQYGTYFYWDTPILDVNVTAPGTSAVTRTLTIPAGFKLLALMNVEVVSDSGASDGVAYLSSLDSVDVAPSATAAPLAGVGISGNTGAGKIFGVNSVWTNTSAQIRSRVSNSSTNVALRIATLGWFDNLGKI